MTHVVAEPVEVHKMAVHERVWRGTCSCGWQAKGWGSLYDANKDAQQHVDAKNAQEMYPDHAPETALFNYKSGREVYDTNGDMW